MVFIGTEAIADGRITRDALQRWYRQFFAVRARSVWWGLSFPG
jgi:hypothetical protein